MLAVRKTQQTEYQSEAAQLSVGQVRKPAKKKVNPWSRYFMTVALAVAVGIFITGRHAEIARTSYEIAKIKYTVAKLEKENEALQISVASLKAPGRVQEIAVARLGMQLPEKVYYASVPATDNTKQTNAVAVRTAAAPWGAKAEARAGR
ncbi:MAG: hypothetical protein AAGU23_04390 [Bacillota bacterium]